MLTVRIPELPNIDLYGGLELEDRVPLWMAGPNKTVYVPVSLLRTFILTGGIGTVAPSVNGNSIIVTIGLTNDGLDTYNIPAIAGKDFVLRRNGAGGALPLDQYQILSAGGFKLTGAPLLSVGEVFELELSEPAGPLINTAVNIPFNGVLLVSSSRLLNNTHVGKLIQIRSQTDQITVTLPSVSLVPAHSIYTLEANITNTYPCRILTSGGQYIYFQNAGKTQMYLGLGENITFYRGDDGWYVYNAFGNWLEVGAMQMRYKVGLNEVAAQGQLVSRAYYPRLWEYASTLGDALVTDAVWISGNPLYPYRGTFSSGDLSTTFRIPDWRNMFPRGLADFTTFGASINDRWNIPGGYQFDQIISHVHTGDMGDGNTGSTIPDNVQNGPLNTPRAKYTTDATGGTETRGKNIGIIWTIKC